MEKVWAIQSTLAHGKRQGKCTNIYEVADAIFAQSQRYGGFHSIITHSFGGMCAAYSIAQGLEINNMVSLCPPQTAERLVDKFCTTLHIPAKANRIVKQLMEARFGENVWSEISMENNVRHLKIPGLIVHDEHDIDVPWQEGQAVAQAWPQAQFIKTVELGHRRILRDEATIKNVTDFISTDNTS